MKLLEYSSDYYSTSIDLTSSGANQRLAQEFKLKYAAGIGRVGLYLQKTGSPSGYLQVEIHPDDNSLPSGTAIANGSSIGVPMSSVSSSLGWVYFDFDLDARPAIHANTLYHIVLKASSGYVYSDGVTEISWGCDQTDPHYVDGQGETYSATSTTWSNISTATDFCFQLVSRLRTDDVYASISQVAALESHLTNLKTFNHSDESAIDATYVYDFIDTISGEIDLWLSGAGYPVPVTSSAVKEYLSRFANAGVAEMCEMTQRTIGFRGERGADTHIGALRATYHELRDGLKDGNEIVAALHSLGLTRTTRGALSAGLTAGGIVSSECDDYSDDDTLTQWKFTRDMLDNS